MPALDWRFCDNWTLRVPFCHSVNVSFRCEAGIRNGRPNAGNGHKRAPNQFANSCFTQRSVASHFVIAQAFPHLIEKGVIGMPKALSSIRCTFAPFQGGAA